MEPNEATAPGQICEISQTGLPKEAIETTKLTDSTTTASSIDKTSLLRPFFLSGYKFSTHEHFEFISLIPTAKGKLYLGAAYTQTEKWLNELQEKGVVSVYSIGFRQWPPFSPCSPHPFVKDVRRTLFLWDDKVDAVVHPEFKNDLLSLTEKLEHDLSSGRTVFIHCHAGISRSATAVIFYLMTKEGKTFQEAFEHVRQHRYVICPNTGFITFLQRFDFQLRNIFWKDIWSQVHEFILPSSVKLETIKYGRLFWGPEKIPSCQITPDEITYYLDCDILPQITDHTVICLPPLIETTLFRTNFIREIKFAQSLLFNGHNIYLCSIDGCGANLLMLAGLMYLWQISSEQMEVYFASSIPQLDLTFLKLVPLLLGNP